MLKRIFRYENDEWYGPTVTFFNFLAVSLFSNFTSRFNLTICVPHHEWEFYSLRNFDRWQRHHAKRGTHKRFNLFYRHANYRKAKF